mgnify:CR=1 FL=1
MRAIVRATGLCVPERVLTNHDLEKMVDTSDQWIRERTGMVERRITDEQTAASDLALGAAHMAMNEAGVAADELDAILVATISPDYVFPATACLLQKRLGARTVASFDLSAACTGFLYGLQIAGAFIESGRYRNILLVGVDTLSKVVDWEDRNTCVLFGDGAGAVILQPGESGGLLGCVLGADGGAAELLYQPCGGSRIPISTEAIGEKKHNLFMNGREIFKHAVREMANSCLAVLDNASLSQDDVAALVPHQANIRIIEAVAQRLGFPMEKVFLNLQKYGNTSAATIPMALHEAREEGKIKSGDKVLMTSFGSGLTWGAGLIEL